MSIEKIKANDGKLTAAGLKFVIVIKKPLKRMCKMSKLRTLLLLSVSLLMCIVSSACFLNDLGAPDTPDVPTQFDKATVMSGIDGDTIYARLPDGSEQKVRLLGINCPELATKSTKAQNFSQEATEYTRSNLLNKTVYLEKDVSDKDSYGRLLRYVWLSPPTEITNQEITTKMFNAILVTNGYASTYTASPDTKYRNYFANYLKKAKTDKKGVWATKNTAQKK